MPELILTLDLLFLLRSIKPFLKGEGEKEGWVKRKRERERWAFLSCYPLGFFFFLETLYSVLFVDFDLALCVVQRQDMTTF